MENTPKVKKAQALVEILERINRGVDPKRLCREASCLLPDIGPSELAAAEKKLIESGYSPHLVEQLSSVFIYLAMLKEQNSSLKARLAPRHILRKVMAEHEMLRCFLADLNVVESQIQQNDNLTTASSEFRRLVHIARHLDAMEEHIAREEDVIFPTLKHHGWSGLCRFVHTEHTYIRIAISDLIDLIKSFDPGNTEGFKARLHTAIAYLAPTMAEHLFEEDNIIYPIAFELIEDNKVWERIKVVCDDIDYCGLHI